MVARMSEHLDLADWRRRMHAIYAAVRAGDGPHAAPALAFRAARDRLFAEHPSSPIPPDERARFKGLAHWPYDPDFALLGRFTPERTAVAPDVPRSASGPAMPFERIGWVSFSVRGTACRLSVLWLNEYAGGIFISFRDATSGHATYGGGRYLWDSAKGADLGTAGEDLVLDFNYAYHPSCVYDPRWSCPLSPPENRLAVAIEAGERLPGAHTAP